MWQHVTQRRNRREETFFAEDCAAWLEVVAEGWLSDLGEERRGKGDGGRFRLVPREGW